MTGSRSSWSTLELELFRDGELPEKSRAELSEALRLDPALRDRLAGAGRIDSLAREGMLNHAAPARHAGGWRIGRLAVGAMAAIAAVVAVSFGVKGLSSRNSVVIPAAPLAEGDVPEAKQVGGEGVRVVFSIPVKARVPKPAEHAGSPVVELVERALADGDGSEARGLLAGAGRADREAAYKKLGETLCSAQAAREAINGLSDAEKLEVCRVWAGDPRLVSVAFSVLGELSGIAGIAEEYRKVVSELKTDPRLRGYVLSYLPKPAAGS